MTDNPYPAMISPTTRRKGKRASRASQHVCAKCGRKLRERYVYSRFTKQRYCFPSEGCER